MGAEARRVVEAVLAAVVVTGQEDRELLDRLDAVAGDGDSGTTLARGAAALLGLDGQPATTAGERLRAAGAALTAAMGGTSGPLWGVAMIRAGGVLDDPAGRSGAALAAAALQAAADGITEYGGARRGDKTFLDALLPAADALADPRTDDPLAAAVAAATGAAEASADLVARRGRASYAGAQVGSAPDAGATAVAAVLGRFAAAPSATLADVPARPATPSSGEGAPDQPHGALLVEDPDRLVSDALDGLVAAHPTLLRRLAGVDVVVRADAPQPGRVAVVSGGGAGHEPLHAGFVGPGMLDAACPGAVFTSPAPAAVHAATRAVDGGAGVLHVVKNYTGDVLNFRLAAELAAADGVRVEAVVVADDVALPADAPTGRRGTLTTVAVERLAGALAATGADLDAVTALARRVAAAGRSYGIALDHPTPGEMELGVGIHGEPGRAQVPLAGAQRIAEALVDAVTAELGTAPGRCLVLLSGLGGTPPLELHALYARVAPLLGPRGVEPTRVLVGDLVTSLGQPGAVLCVLPLDAVPTPGLERLWDAPLRTAALAW